MTYEALVSISRLKVGLTWRSITHVHSHSRSLTVLNAASQKLKTQLMTHRHVRILCTTIAVHYFEANHGLGSCVS
jgi:hypothetical protein